jgi:hypothetical protein
MQGIREIWKYLYTYLYFKSRIYVRKVKRKLTVEGTFIFAWCSAPSHCVSVSVHCRISLKVVFNELSPNCKSICEVVHCRFCWRYINHCSSPLGTRHQQPQQQILTKRSFLIATGTRYSFRECFPEALVLYKVIFKSLIIDHCCSRDEIWKIFTREYQKRRVRKFINHFHVMHKTCRLRTVTLLVSLNVWLAQ